MDEGTISRTVSVGGENTMRFLLTRTPKDLLKDSDALHEAVIHDKVEMARLLIEDRGMDVNYMPKVPPHQRPWTGYKAIWTPLHEASF